MAATTGRAGELLLTLDSPSGQTIAEADVDHLELLVAALGGVGIDGAQVEQIVEVEVDVADATFFINGSHVSNQDNFVL